METVGDGDYVPPEQRARQRIDHRRERGGNRAVTAGPDEPPRAFWSYVRDDDRAEGGRIVDLATRLREQVALITTEVFPVFVDQLSISWGANWREEIDRAVASASFLIPIVTPRYFKSDACRHELISFQGVASSHGVPGLIMPVYYFDVPGLEDGSSDDEIMGIIRAAEWVDFRDAALEDPESSPYRKAVRTLAREIAARIQTIEATPTEALGDTDIWAPGTPAADDHEDEPGIFEILADGESAAHEVGERLNGLAPLLEALGVAARTGTERIEASDSSGKGFAGRVVAARALAKDLAEPADRIETLAADVLRMLLKIDPMIEILVDLSRNDPSQRDGLRNLFEQLDELGVVAGEFAGNMAHLASTVEEVSKWSRDLRPPSRKVAAALRQLADSNLLFARWQERAKELLG